MAYRNQTQYMDGNSGYASQSPMHSPPVQRSGATAADVPGAVSALLDSTRRLEEALRAWSALEVSETEVSDVFVVVGNCYNELLAAFSAYGIDMRDVSNFLNDLRMLLEECLSEDPTPQNVNYLMPQVRTIIANLLVGLRSKRDVYWRTVGASARRPGSRSSSGSGSGAGYR